MTCITNKMYSNEIKISATFSTTVKKLKPLNISKLNYTKVITRQVCYIIQK